MTIKIASAAESIQLMLLPRADHFIAGQIEPPQPTLACWLTSCIKEQL